MGTVLPVVYRGEVTVLPVQERGYSVTYAGRYRVICVWGTTLLYREYSVTCSRGVSCCQDWGYCITCVGGTGAGFSWTLIPVWPPRQLTQSAPPDLKHQFLSPLQFRLIYIVFPTLGVLVPSAFLIC